MQNLDKTKGLIQTEVGTQLIRPQSKQVQPVRWSSWSREQKCGQNSKTMTKVGTKTGKPCNELTTRLWDTQGFIMKGQSGWRHRWENINRKQVWRDGRGVQEDEAETINKDQLFQKKTGRMEQGEKCRLTSSLKSRLTWGCEFRHICCCLCAWSWSVFHWCFLLVIKTIIISVVTFFKERV